LPDGNIERKGRSENRNALLKTHNSGQESSKLIGSFCRKLIVYWTDFSEVSAALLKSCNWKFKGTIERNQYLSKLISYLIWLVQRLVGKSGNFLVCFETTAVVYQRWVFNVYHEIAQAYLL